jgi:putative FmdB family regulatory protein
MIYEYLCTKCDLSFDAEHPVEERDQLTYCPECHGLGRRFMAPTRLAANVGKGSRIPGWCTSLPGKPVYVRSKAHFKELCKKNGDLYPAGL